MNTVIHYKRDTVAMRAVLSVDADTLAERLHIIDRRLSEHIRTIKLDTPEHTQILLPRKHALTGNVAVIMLDDDRFYNAAIVDGVVCELINCAELDTEWSEM
ncbi:hypothetical protein ACRWQN_17485 [Shewanella sp. HL-SH8]|uniref:hypothetical protein n=1 Tax=Shewanella sp. HL-SH8 TaxID=3436242 RepID=UPI003EC0E14B